MMNLGQITILICPNRGRLASVHSMHVHEWSQTEVKLTASTLSPPVTLDEAGGRARNVEAGYLSAQTVS